MHIRMAALAAALFVVVLISGSAGAQVQPYGTDDFGGFHDVLPPGTNGLANAPQLATFLGFGRRPGHNDDQLAMYRDLIYTTPGLQAQDIPKYFKDSTFGVQDADIASTISPRSDVTIIRDRDYGVPHIYGTTRDGAMFGTGYAAAQDRLFFIDVLRHLGRAQLASFAGGAAGNRAFDESQWAIAPYTEEDLQKQVDAFPRQGAEGTQLRHDLDEYVAGINQYIAEARLDPTKMPASTRRSTSRSAPTRGRSPTSWRPHPSSAASSARAAAGSWRRCGCCGPSPSASAARRVAPCGASSRHSTIPTPRPPSRASGSPTSRPSRCRGTAPASRRPGSALGRDDIPAFRRAPRARRRGRR
ncbi:MAG: Penicillin amidase, partial [Solirubrobacterales bacterium]|nr:Penicillin amidase [Solirubrobacterales bacterium]